MVETLETKSRFSAWASALFVAVFFLLWVLTVTRLHEHFNGESFLHRNGIVDSLIAVFAPLAILVRFWQVKENKVHKA